MPYVGLPEDADTSKIPKYAGLPEDADTSATPALPQSEGTLRKVVSEPFRVAGEAVAGLANLPVKAYKGYKGLGTLATGGSLEDAVAAVGERNVITSPLAPSATGQTIGKGINYLGQVTGQPELVSGLAEAGGDIATLFGAKALSPRNMLSVATKVIPERAEVSMYQRALKPHSGLSNSLKPEELARRVNTGLNEGIPITKGGLERSRATISDLNTEIQQRINEHAAQNASISRDRAITNAGDAMSAKLGKEALPAEPRGQVQSVLNEFATEHPEQINIRQAQDYKQSLNRNLDDFYKALATSPDKTTQISKAWTNKTKAALRDDLAAQITEIFPEVKNLNQREGALIQLNKSLEKAVNRIGQHDLLSLKGLIAITKDPKWAVTNYILNNPTVQSHLAVALRSARNAPVAPGTFTKAVLGLGGQELHQDPLGIRE